MIHLSTLLLASALGLPQETQAEQGALQTHVETLTSEAFGGRGLGEPGAELTVEYLVQALKELGLEPAGQPDGEGNPSFRQSFELYRYNHSVEPKLILTRRDGQEEVGVYGLDFTVNTQGLMRGTEKLEVYYLTDARVGKEVTSPDRALVFCLPVPFRTSVLKEREMLEPESWGLEIRPHSSTRQGTRLGIPAPRFERKPPVEKDERFEMITLLGKLASDLNWRGYTHAQFIANEECQRVMVSNVVAVLPGSDPKLAKESVLLQTFYDHDTGRVSATGRADRGTHGAGAVASLLEVAAQLAKGEAPARSVVFLFSFGQANRGNGLSSYLKQPVRPLQKTVGALSVVRPGLPLEQQAADGKPRVALTAFEESPLGAACVERGLPVVEGKAVQPLMFQASRLMSKRGLPAQILGTAYCEAPGCMGNQRFEPTDYEQLEVATETLLGATRILAAADYQKPAAKQAKQRKFGR